jgi:dipeptidyl aminopeptidase/acylaminoacyl peptidase
VFFHGTEDPRVPYERARLLEAALRYAGIFTSFTAYEGAGHGLQEFRPDIIAKTATLLYLTTVTRQIPCRI